MEPKPAPTDNAERPLSRKQELVVGGVLLLLVLVYLSLQYGNPQACRLVYMFQCYVNPQEEPKPPSSFTGKWTTWTCYGTVKNEKIYRSGRLYDWKKDIGIGPTDLIRRGFRYDGEGRDEDAIADYTKAIERLVKESETNNRLLALAHFNRAVVYYRLMKKRVALNDYTEAIKYSPDDAMAYNNRGLCKFDLGDYSEARKDYQKAIDLNTNPQAKLYALDNLGLLSLAEGDLSKAAKYYDLALQVIPNENEALRRRGIIRFYSGQQDLALEDLKQSLRSNASDPYTVIWDYLIRMSQANEPAAVTLETPQKQPEADQRWLHKVIALFSGNSSPEACLEAITHNDKQIEKERQCQLYLYLGYYHLFHNDRQKAKHYFSLALATETPYIFEHAIAKVLKQKKPDFFE